MDTSVSGWDVISRPTSAIGRASEHAAFTCVLPELQLAYCTTYSFALVLKAFCC